MAQPPTLLLIIEMDWGEAWLSPPCPRWHTPVCYKHMLPLSESFLVVPISFKLPSFLIIVHTLVSLLHSSPITFLSFHIQFRFLCNLLRRSLIMDIMHFSNQLCCDWTEMIWLDHMRIADPVLKLNSFYLIYSPSDLQVELYPPIKQRHEDSQNPKGITVSTRKQHKKTT